VTYHLKLMRVHRTSCLGAFVANVDPRVFCKTKPICSCCVMRDAYCVVRSAKRCFEKQTQLPAVGGKSEIRNLKFEISGFEKTKPFSYLVARISYVVI